MVALLQDHVLAAAAEFGARFRPAEPFPHIVIDQFLRDEAVHALLAEFPAFERGGLSGDGWELSWLLRRIAATQA